MTEPTMRLAARAGCDPHFLAFALAVYAADEGLTDEALTAALGATPAGLASARLCRMPRADAGGFREDVERIAAKFGLKADVLGVMVRRGQTVAALRQAAESYAESVGPMLAARDRDAPDEG